MKTPEFTNRYERLVRTLIRVLESRNPSDLDHCRLVARYADMLAAHVGLDAETRARLVAAAEIHTLGVQLQLAAPRSGGIPVCRSSPLDACGALEREADMLASVLGGDEALERLVPLIVARHAWYDGRTSSCSGEDIAVEARILALVDAFVDLSTPKSHRDALDVGEVLSRLRAGAGQQFDPVLVERFTALVAEEDDWEAGARVRRFTLARCRYWLHEGHLHRQRRDLERALGCYAEAASLGEQMCDAVFVQQALFGLGLTCLEREDGAAAAEVLERARTSLGQTQGSARLWHALLSALCEWQQGRREGAQRLLAAIMTTSVEEGEISCLATAAGLQANLVLAWRGAEHPEFLRVLGAFIDIIERYDVLDEVIRLRPQTMPVLHEAVRADVRAGTAQAVLARLGEPCRVPVSAARPDGPPSAPCPPPPPVRRSTSIAHALAAPAAIPRGVRVQTLGDCTVTVGTRVITKDDWPVQKAMRLFALLAHRREAVYDAVLTAAFWPESDEEHARASLRNALYYVRTVLERAGRESGVEDVPEVARSRRSRTISLRGEVQVDAVAFEHGIESASAVLAEEAFSEARRVLIETLALYRGPFMDGVEDEWVRGPRAHYEELYLRGMQMLARCHIALGEAEAAEKVARRALRRDELRETLHVALIEALLAQGRRAEAMRQYQEAAALFEREFGISVPRILTDIFPRLVA